MNTTEASPPDVQEPAEAPNAPLTGNSVLDTVRGIRAQREAADPRRLELVIPGYEGRLAVIYRYPADGVDRVLGSIERGVEAETGLGKVEAAADRLVACCAAIVGRDENDKPIDLISGQAVDPEALPDAPLRFDLRFAELLGLTVPGDVKAKARFIVRSVFSPMALRTGVYEGDLALISAGNMLINWLTGEAADVEEAALGE